MSGRSPDVAIIGGGIIGVSVAAHLAAGGARVVVYERDAVAAGASGRNSGIVLQPFDPILARLYMETLELYRVVGDESDTFHFPARPAGLLKLAPSGSRDAIRQAAADLLLEHPELEPEFLDVGQATRLEPGLAQELVAYRLSIGYPVGPADATMAWARRAERLGARFEIGAAARPWVVDGVARGILVGDRREAAGSVVVAAGPWSPALLDESGRWLPIVPLWGVVADVALADPPSHFLEEAEIDIEPAGTGADDGPPGSSTAFTLVTAARRSSLGSTFQPDQPVPERSVPNLVARGSMFLPSLATAPVLAVRTCARPLSRDGRPLIGAVPGLERAYIAAGHGPWGISTGPATGRLLATLILRARADIPPELDPSRFGLPSFAGGPPDAVSFTA